MSSFVRTSSSECVIRNCPIEHSRRKTSSERCYPATLFCSNKRTAVLKFPQLIPLPPCRPSVTSWWIKLRKRSALIWST